MVPDVVPGSGRLADFTVLLYSQWILVYQCPLGFVLVEDLPSTKSCMAEERGVNVLLYSRLVGCSPTWAGPILSVESGQLGSKSGKCAWGDFISTCSGSFSLKPLKGS